MVPVHATAQETTCYASIFYPFVTAWDAPAGADVNVPYQAAKAYGLLLMATAALGSVLWLTTR